MKARDYQHKAALAVIEQWKKVRSTLVVMPTGCHAKGTPLLMHSGLSVMVEDVCVGDVLMGPDSTPRTVLQLAHGRGNMYRIVPVKGKPFIVNEDHILSLVQTQTRSSTSSRQFPCDKRGGTIIDVSVKEWLGWSKNKKNIHKLFRVGVDFPPNRSGISRISPYMAGVLLGDGGLRKSINVTTADPEIVSEIQAFATSWGMLVRKYDQPGNASSTYFIIGQTRIRGKRSDLGRELKFLGMRGCGAGNKEIPFGFKTGSRKDRLSLLAGLIDTDGSPSCGGYDYISKSRKLAHDVAFVARSVGLAAYVKPCVKSCQTGARGTYYRVSISGDCSIIPCQIKRKTSGVRRQIKSVLRTGFTVEPVGPGEYFGFSLDGDGRYVMGDFTVTHNTGKTILFADIIRRCFPKRALVLAHREELIFQAQDKIHRVTGYQVEVEMADLRASLTGLQGRTHVVVSTIQTQTAGGDGGGRMGKFLPTDFGLLIIDESHMAVSKTFKRAIAYYGQNPNLKILGVTATPDRADEVALGQVFDSVAFEYDLLDIHGGPSAITDGWLVPVVQQTVEVGGLDFSKVRTTAGDLNGADLAAVMESEHILQEIAHPMLEAANGFEPHAFDPIPIDDWGKYIANHGTPKCTLVFTTSVKQAEQFAEIINRHCPGSAGWICGKTPKEDRRRLLAEFASGTLQYMVNVGVLTHGYDNSAVKLVVMAKPTKSRALYAQMAGRGTRPLEEIVKALNAAPDAETRKAIIASSAKPAVTILDFAGNAGRHKLMTTADILGGNVSDEAVELAASMARKAGKPMRMDETLVAAEEELKRREEARQKDAARRARLVAKAQFSVQSVDPFNVLAISPQRERGWDSGKTLSPAQRALVEKYYPDVNFDQLPYAQGKQLCNEMFRRWKEKLCTYKQSKQLVKRGYDTKNMTMADAGKILDGLFGNKKAAV